MLQGYLQRLQARKYITAEVAMVEAVLIIGGGVLTIGEGVPTIMVEGVLTIGEGVLIILG